MSEPFRPDADDDEPPDRAADPDSASEPQPGGPLTAYEILLVREAEGVIERCAKRIAREFPRIVRENGLVTLGDLEDIGYEALARAAQTFDEKRSDDFVSFARHIVRYRMLNAIGDLLYEERLKHAAIKAEENFCAFFADPDYNVMKHDGQEARRRYRAFLNGVITATFVATTEAARQCLDDAVHHLAIRDRGGNSGRPGGAPSGRRARWASRSDEATARQSAKRRWQTCPGWGSAGRPRSMALRRVA